MEDRNLKQLLKKFGYGNLFYDIVFIIISLFMIVKDYEFTKIICVIVGIVTIYDGILRIITYFECKNDLFSGYDYNLNFGILSVIIGVVLITFAEVLIKLFMIIIAVYIIYNACMSLIFAISIRKFDRSAYFIELITSIVIILIGIIMLFTPEFIVRAIGYILFVYAVISLIQSITYIKSIKNL